MEYGSQNAYGKSSSPISRVNGNVLSYIAEAAMEFIQLPSRIRGIDLMQWSFPLEHVGRHECGEYVFDPAQDLLVVAAHDPLSDR